MRQVYFFFLVYIDAIHKTLGLALDTRPPNFEDTSPTLADAVS